MKFTIGMEVERLTVGELRELLKYVRDDMQVWVSPPDGDVAQPIKDASVDPTITLEGLKYGEAFVLNAVEGFGS